jgi:hypothetical protein
MKKTLLILILLLPLIETDTLMAQACSCGGAPLMSSMDLPSTPAGSWQIGLTYEFNSISDVVSRTTELNDDTRSRSVHSGILEISYGIGNRLSLSTLFTFLQQERNSGIQGGSGEFLRTRGFGDGLFILKYDLFPYTVSSQRQLAVGGGIKIPFGKSSLLSNGSLIAADMQPGTGSWDAVLWGYAYQGLQRYFPAGLFISGTYRFSGGNNRFGSSNEGYKFGNELITTVGINHDPVSFLDYTIAFRYRQVGADSFANGELTNSGGKWLDFAPGIVFNISQSIGLRSSARIPLYRKLEGTQLTTSYSLLFSVFYSISKSKPTFEIQ